MQHQDRLWYLLSRYLAEEATEYEIKELSNLTANDTRIAEAVNLLRQFWGTTITADTTELQSAWEKLVGRLD